MINHEILKNARNNKKDEFFTSLSEIEKELEEHKDYKRHFEDKVVFCNCNDARPSNFYLFFKKHFIDWKIKKLIATKYSPNQKETYKIEITKKGNSIDIQEKTITGSGDFRDEECVSLLKESDIIVTNPPFSLFRSLVDILMEYNKKFILIGSTNAASYTDFFSWIQKGEISTGYGFNKSMIFEVGKNYKYDEKLTNKINDGKYYGKVPMIAWYTNLELDKKHIPLKLTKKYYGNEQDYYTYHNYPAINCDKTKDIPYDYDGIIGVPITFLGSYCPEQFEIVGMGYGELAKKIGMTTIGKEFLEKYFEQGNKGNYVANNVLCCYTDKDDKVHIPYARILIKKKQKNPHSI